ncbi:hypothetical protein ACF0H5_018058 [Mactra antiquata]
MATKPQKKSSSNPCCKRHNGETITVYSVKLGKCMCLKCAMQQHDNLSDFMPISEGVEIMKSAGKNIVEEITLMSEMTRTMKNDRQNTIENIRKSDKNIRAQIRKTRDNLNRHLDLIEQNMTGKLKTILDKSERSFLKDQSDIHRLEAQLKKMKENVEILMKTGSGIDLISGVTNERVVFLQKKADIRSLQENMPPKIVQFKISPAVLEFIENVKTFGQVSLHSIADDDYDNELNLDTVHKTRNKKPYSFPGSNAMSPVSFRTHNDISHRHRFERFYDSRSTKKYGIRASNPYHPMSEQSNGAGNTDFAWKEGGDFLDAYDDFEGLRDDPFIYSADHGNTCNLTGVTSLTDGRVVVCDSKHKSLQLIDRQSEILDELVFHYKPCNVASISDNDVIVSFIDKDFISIFNATARAIRHVRNLSVSGRGGSYSLAYSSKKIAVCRRGEIRVLALDNGELISKIQIDAHFPQIAMSDGGNKIYLSDFVGGKVLCMNEQGRTKWEYGKEDLEPCNLAIDLNQLFVADVKGRILVLSTYGVLVRVVQCQGRLQAISVDPNTGTLLITLENSRDRKKSRSITIRAI